MSTAKPLKDDFLNVAPYSPKGLEVQVFLREFLQVVRTGTSFFWKGPSPLAYPAVTRANDPHQGSVFGRTPLSE